MAYYLVKLDGNVYANYELYQTAIAKGERAFAKMLANKTVVGKTLLDHILFPVDGAQREICNDYNPVIQDFDDFFKHINVVSKDTLNQIKKGGCPAFPNSLVISTNAENFPEQFKYRQVAFFRIRDYKGVEKYKLLGKVASVKVCGSVYIALNAVDVRNDSPYIITLKK